ncbi:early nodulin-75-like [Cynoglossus semilaevis]|uniref:early nodulin-75-like n=1 Tax=Cynoglossus semilaevis TaxID=244447 RepID=UPI0007DCA050|nr:early nodulin-75-like [Cynoglossus semilaevis]
MATACCPTSLRTLATLPPLQATPPTSPPHLQREETATSWPQNAAQLHSEPWPHCPHYKQHLQPLPHTYRERKQPPHGHRMLPNYTQVSQTPPTRPRNSDQLSSDFYHQTLAKLTPPQATPPRRPQNSAKFPHHEGHHQLSKQTIQSATNHTQEASASTALLQNNEPHRQWPPTPEATSHILQDSPAATLAHMCRGHTQQLHLKPHGHLPPNSGRATTCVHVLLL